MLEGHTEGAQVENPWAELSVDRLSEIAGDATAPEVIRIEALVTLVDRREAAAQELELHEGVAPEAIDTDILIGGILHELRTSDPANLRLIGTAYKTRMVRRQAPVASFPTPPVPKGPAGQ